MKKSIFSVLCIIASLSLISIPAQAAWDVTAKVVTIEPSYMPDTLLFTLDAVAGTCSAGNWIQYTGTNYGSSDPKKNVQAIYAGLLTALNSGKLVEVHGNDNCLAINIHPTSQQ